MKLAADWPAREGSLVPVTAAADAARVEVAADGFLGGWIERNRASLLAALASDILLGFEARAAGKQPDDRNLRLAADSDLYKWLEGAAYVAARTGDRRIREALDRVADLIVQCQHDDGYLNTQVPPNARFDAAVNHDLYLAGHFFEAAVAHHRATGQSHLLAAACRWADYLWDEHESGNPYFATVGEREHSEYELGLLRLARATGNQRYLRFAAALARRCRVGTTVAAVHAGAGQLHAVRVGYLLAGYADLFLETGDRSFVEHLPALWNELVDTRMYPTGAVGSHGEIISTEPFDLPHTQDHPHRTMGETCAAIAMVMFSWRMHSILGTARVFDVIERVLYNHVLGAVSLDGLGHFYYNPMQVVGDQSGRTDHWHVPATARCRLPELNRTTCCMPNLWRFFGALPEYLYSTDGDGVAINLYTSSRVACPVRGGEVALSVTTDYPHDGAITIRYQGERPAAFPLTLRIPVWARVPRLRLPDGSSVTPPSGVNHRVDRRWQPGDQLRLELDLTPQLLLTDTRVTPDRGHAVLGSGPLRYCLESEDLSFPVEEAGLGLQPGELAAQARVEWRAEVGGGLHTLTVPGWRGKPTQAEKLTLIPWYARANRSADSRWVLFLPHADRAPAESEEPSAETLDLDRLRRLAGSGCWRPVAHNPVLTPGPYGSWDGWNVATMSVLRVADTLHLYYEAGRTGVEDYQIGHATSRDGLHWRKDPANPVVPFGGAGAWDHAETWDPFVLYEDGVFKLWYGGTRHAGGDSAARDFQLGYATSTDGTHFEQRRCINALRNRDHGLGQIADMHVVHDRERGQYVLFYWGLRDGVATIRRATAPNETDFDLQAATAIGIDGEEAGYRCPHVMLEDGVWHMHYGYKYQPRAGYAVSEDGVSWQSQNPCVIDGHDPEALRLAADLWLLLYCPSQYNMGHEPGCDIRAALLSGSPRQLAALGVEPDSGGRRCGGSRR